MKLPSPIDCCLCYFDEIKLLFKRVPMTNFRGKTVVITGASAGVGAATARAFANLGANLVLLARGEAGLTTISEELSTLTEVLPIVMNVNDLSWCQQAIDMAVQRFGHVDVLVNNAGFHQRGNVADNSVNDLAQMIDVNLRSPIVLSRLVIELFKQQGGGAIVNVGSLAGRAPLQGAATYAATKAGLRSFTYALADEHRDNNINIGLVSPGSIDTGFIMDQIDQVEDIVFSQPMSSAEEVAIAIVRVAKGEKIEICLPSSSGWLTHLGYLFPRLRRAIRKSLDEKGRKNKEKYRKNST